MYVKIYVLISKNTDGVEIYIFAQGNLLNFVINNKVSTKIFNGNPNIWVKLIEIKDKLIRSIPIIIIGLIMIQTKRFVIIKYGLKILKEYIIYGNIISCADIVTLNISFIFSNFADFKFILYFHFLFLILKLFNIFNTVLLKTTIPIVPRYESINPLFSTKYGLFKRIINIDKLNVFQKSFFL